MVKIFWTELYKTIRGLFQTSPSVQFSMLLTDKMNRAITSCMMGQSHKVFRGPKEVEMSQSLWQTKTFYLARRSREGKAE